MALKSDAKFKKNQFLFKNCQELGKFWSEHPKGSKICTLIDPFHAKYITFDLKKYRWVIFHDTEVQCKIWRKTDLWFGKLHEGFGKFSPEHLEVSKLGPWWDAFVQRGHSKSTFVVQGSRGSLKSELKQTGGGGSSLSVRSLCAKLPDRVLSDKLLGS